MKFVSMLLVFSCISLTNFAQTGIGGTPSSVAGISPGKLDILGTGDFSLRLRGDSFVGFGIQSFREASSDHAILNLFGSRGTMASPTTLLNGDNISTISSRAYNGSSYNPVTSIQSFFGGSNQGILTFSTNAGSGTLERMRIQATGNVGIGTSNPLALFHVVGGYQRLEYSNPVYLDFNHSSSTTDKKIIRIGNDSGAMIFDRVNDAYSTSTESMRISNTGQLGIGTTSPQTALHIENGNLIGTGNPGANTLPSIYVFNNNANSTSAHSIVGVRTNGTNSGNPYYSLDVNGKFGYSMGLDNANSQFLINSSWDFNTSAANKMIIMNRTGPNRVIVPNYTGAFVTDWPSGWGGGFATYDISASGIYYNVLIQRSDKRLKNEIKLVDTEVIAKLMQLKPVSYYWEKEHYASDTKLQYGLIAQEVEPIFPEMVSTATDSMQTKSVNYQALHALSLKMLQIHEQSLKKLEQALVLEKEKNEQLSGQLANLPQVLLKQIQLMSKKEKKALKKLLKE